MIQPRRPTRSILRVLLYAGALLTPVAAGGDGHGHWAEVDGHPMYYLRAGTGSPVLLLHGGGDSGEGSFTHQIRDLVDAGHAVIAPDQVGQGQTPDLPGPLNYTAMMEDTADLLRQLRIESVDVVGFSDGGILALMLAARYPDLVHRLAVSGVNISPAGIREVELDELRAASDAAAETGESPGLDAKLRDLWLNAPTEDDLSRDALAGIRQPVLIMSGDHDVIRLDHTLAIYRALPNAQLFVLPATGHRIFDSRPDLVNPVLLGFLGGS
jgi:pimeloyl-ACP methyl ester carboxylesterase